MNKLLLLFVIWFSAPYMYAERIDVQTAQKVAINLATQLQKRSPRLKSTSPVSISLVYTAQAKGLAYKQPQSASAPADYYAFNVGTNQGFVIVSGEDRVRPVIGYAPEGEFKTENMPDNIKAWLERYQREITYAVAQKTQASSKIQQEWQAYMSGTMKSNTAPVVQLKTANWGQGEPYNKWCPMMGGKRAVTGCVATAQAIVMKYHGYPARATAGVSQYYDLPITYDNYDWNNMLLSYDRAYTQAQSDAVAKLMFHCGANVEMEYSPNASGAITAYIAPSLIKNFGYDKQARHINKGQYKWGEWKKIINKELDAKCPVIYNGKSDQGGHAFVCDGYTSEGAYHINWGWGGFSNGYFLLSTLDADGTGDGYDDLQGLIIGIKPMAGNEYIQSLRVSKSITSNTTSVTANTSFSLSATVISEGSTPFNGYINAALVDSNYKIRKLISNNRRITNLNLGYQINLTLSCNATLEPNPTDKVVIVYSLDNINWVIIQGGSGLASEMSVTSGVINPGPDDPNEPNAPLNVSMSYNEFNFSYVANKKRKSGVIYFSSSNLQIPLRFRYKLKDPSWKSKINMMYGSDWDAINKDFNFDNDGIAWIDVDGSKIEYGQISQFISLQPTVCGAMEYEITVFDETQTQVYATYNCEMNIVNRIQLPYQEIMGSQGTDTPFSLNVSDFGDFNGKDLKVQVNLHTDLPSKTFTLNYINGGKAETISLKKPYEEAFYLEGEHLISSFSSANGNYTIKSTEKIVSTWLSFEFIDQSNNKSIPSTGGFDVTITGNASVTYPVSLHLQNLSASSVPDAVIKGQSLSLTLTPAISYILPETITVIMGGKTLTVGSDYSYNRTTGAISILSVTGEVIISAKGYSNANIFAYDNLIYRIYNSSQVGIVGPNMSDNMNKKDWTITSCTIPSEVTHNNQTYSVTAIENEAFTNCTGLYSVTLPASIVDLGTFLFGGCEQTLTEIHSKMQFPIRIRDQYTFFRTDDLNGDGVKDAGTATCKLYVPKGTKPSYTVAPGWKEFSNIIEPSDVANRLIKESTNHVFVRSGIVYIEVQEPTEAQIVNYSGQVVRSLNLPAGQTSINGLKQGLYIIKYSGNSTARFSIL